MQQRLCHWDVFTVTDGAASSKTAVKDTDHPCLRLYWLGVRSSATAPHCAAPIRHYIHFTHCMSLYSPECTLLSRRVKGQMTSSVSCQIYCMQEALRRAPLIFSTQHMTECGILTQTQSPSTPTGLEDAPWFTVSVRVREHQTTWNYIAHSSTLKPLNMTSPAVATTLILSVQKNKATRFHFYKIIKICSFKALTTQPVHLRQIHIETLQSNVCLLWSDSWETKYINICICSKYSIVLFRIYLHIRLLDIKRFYFHLTESLLQDTLQGLLT